MMAPLRCRRMIGNTCSHAMIVPRRLIAQTRSNASSVSSSRGLSPPPMLTPTLLCRMSIRPQRASASAIAEASVSCLVTSAATGTHSAPSFCAIAAVSSADATTRSTARILAPSWAKRSVVARPLPIPSPGLCPAPTITATLPSRRIAASLATASQHGVAPPPPQDQDRTPRCLQRASFSKPPRRLGRPRGGFDAFWTAELEAPGLRFLRGASRGDRALTEGAHNSMSELHRRWTDLENECNLLEGAIGIARSAGADVRLLRDRQARLLLEISAVVAQIRDAPAATLADYLALLDVAIEHETDLSIDMACYGPSDFPMFTRLLRGL